MDVVQRNYGWSRARLFVYWFCLGLSFERTDWVKVASIVTALFSVMWERLMFPIEGMEG